MDTDTAILAMPQMLSAGPEIIEERMEQTLARDTRQPALSLWEEFRAQELSQTRFENFLLAASTFAAIPLVGYAFYAASQLATTRGLEAWVGIMTR